VEHGHSYQCRVTVKGPLVAEAGGVMGLEALDRLLAEEITRRLDGRSINEALPEFAPAPARDGGSPGGVRVERIAPQLPRGVHAARGTRAGGAAYLLGIFR